MEQSFCEVKNTDPSQHLRWLEKHGFEPDEKGFFPVDSFEGKLPTTVDKLFDNIRVNVSSGWYQSLYTKPYDERIFVMVCGGPSLADHLGEVREKSLQRDKYLVVCSNMTARYLLEHDIVPHVHFILDPQEKKQFDVAPGSTHQSIEYWINVACDPSVFNALREQDIKPHAFLADFECDGKAIQTVKDSMLPGQDGMMAIQGGTMAGLRAINLADSQGFREFEYYGFDATVQINGDRARPYAYEKKRGEAIIEVKCDRCDAIFDTTLVFQRQVNEFLAWKASMPWINFKIIGGGLIAHYKDHVDALEAQKPHAAYRYTPEYAALQRELHTKGNYGVSGVAFIPTIFHGVSQLAKRLPSVSVLDYGAAQGHTFQAVRKHFWLPPNVTDSCYDPFVDGFSEEPDPADFVICTDVLEHVEPECTKAVLDHLQQLTRRMLFVSISLVRASKELSDGRNAHINIRHSEFWLKELRKRFILGEAKVSRDGACLLAVGQSIEDVKQILRSNNV